MSQRGTRSTLRNLRQIRIVLTDGNAVRGDDLGMRCGGFPTKTPRAHKGKLTGLGGALATNGPLAELPRSRLHVLDEMVQ